MHAILNLNGKTNLNVLLYFKRNICALKHKIVVNNPEVLGASALPSAMLNL